MQPTREQVYQRRIAELEAENADLKAAVAELRVQVTRLPEQVTGQSEQIAQLTEQIAKLSKNSSNSSKPPSSDIVKPSRAASGKKTNAKKTKRKIGGQPGHAKHERPPFSPEEIDDVRESRLNVDETGHKDNGKPHWTWCFRAQLYTLFKIDRSRGSDVLIDLPDKRTQVYGAIA